MAMLAGPKKKSKYRLQPFSGFSKINKRIDDDAGSFGFKLMASMGWAPGKGLGRHESGNVDPIKLRVKNDEAGLGYKVSEGDALAQQSEFQALLLQLNSGAVEEGGQSVDPKKKSKKEKIRSLEKQSEQSSVRVHYKKFTRGKDLSQASEKDLRSILGVSSGPPKVPKEPVPKNDNSTHEAPKENMYVISGSSVDYFKKKYQEKKVEQELSPQEDDSNERRRVSWGGVDVSYVEKYIKDMVDTSGSVDESVINSVLDKPVKKSKKSKKEKGNYEEVPTEVPENIIEETSLVVNEGKKTKKRKRNRNEEDSSKENLVQEHDNQNVPLKKKKNLADQDEKHIVETNTDVHYLDTEALCPEEPINSNVDLNEVPKKKKKKKKKNQVSALPGKID